MKRIATALVGIPVFVGLTWLGDWPFVALVAVLAVAGQREVLDLFASETHRLGNPLSVLAGLAMAIAPFHMAGLWLIAPLAVGSLVWSLLRAPGGQPLQHLGGEMVGLFYPAAFLAGLLALREPVVAVSWDPFVLTMGMVILIWTGDTAAYYTGRSLGRHKLAPRLSPGKTWEGAIGGGVATLLAATLLAFVWSGNLPLVHWLVIGMIVAFLGPPGDLYESALKRAAGKKDSASWLPGHGGVLDRFDALFFVAPVVAAYLFAVVG